MVVDIDLCVPTLQSNDTQKAFEFYEKFLGFKKNWQHQYEPGLPLFISMSQGKTTVFLTEHKNESAFGAELYLYVNDIETLFNFIKEGGVNCEVELHKTPYGMKEFNLRDPDGNKLRIGQIANESDKK